MLKKESDSNVFAQFKKDTKNKTGLSPPASPGSSPSIPISFKTTKTGSDQIYLKKKTGSDQISFKKKPVGFNVNQDKNTFVPPPPKNGLKTNLKNDNDDRCQTETFEILTVWIVFLILCESDK